MFGRLFGGKSAGYRNATVAETQAAVTKDEAQFVDVRTREEYAGGHAAGTVNVPLDTLAENVGKFDRNKPVYVICQSGMRSQRGAAIFGKAGFGEVFNVSGGTSAWISAGLPAGR